MPETRRRRAWCSDAVTIKKEGGIVAEAPADVKPSASLVREWVRFQQRSIAPLFSRRSQAGAPVIQHAGQRLTQGVLLMPSQGEQT